MSNDFGVSLDFAFNNLTENATAFSVLEEVEKAAENGEYIAIRVIRDDGDMYLYAVNTMTEYQYFAYRDSGGCWGYSLATEELRDFHVRNYDAINETLDEGFPKQQNKKRGNMEHTKITTKDIVFDVIKDPKNGWIVTDYTIKEFLENNAKTWCSPRGIVDELRIIDDVVYHRDRPVHPGLNPYSPVIFTDLNDDDPEQLLLQLRFLECQEEGHFYMSESEAKELLTDLLSQETEEE